jgi:hypothetical protein
MLGNQRSYAFRTRFLGSVEVTLGNGAILKRLRREQGVGEAMLRDELLRKDPKNLRPDFTNSMDTPVTWLIKGLVCRRINGEVLYFHSLIFGISLEYQSHTVE